MKVNLLTDATRHNLALMRVSTYHKQQGNDVYLNMPLMKADVTYASWLFESKERYPADYTGGVGVDPRICLPDEIEICKPDYSLFGPLGYTFRDCYRKCPFCKVPLMKKERKHCSIW